ncbi:MAG TPA: phosphatidate cytidylyltransferase [Thermoanaerobaculia bacterium]|jgi:phosphatidate cytidylyltransferase
MKRLLTAAIGVPFILAAVFLLQGWWFFAAIALIVEGAVWEFAAILRVRAPKAPLRLLLLLAPLAAWGLSFAFTDPIDVGTLRYLLFSAVLALSVGLGTLLLLSRTPLEETLPALGAFAFGVPYFAAATSSIHLLQRADPWLVFLLMAIVWLGDTAAYYVGSRIGRHKMAPVISPKKSWEGAVASFVVAVAAAAVWDVWWRGGLEPGVMAAAAGTAVAAQVGDLVESMIKRGSGVKDSGSILPGHGGVLDRMDAMLFAAPVLLLGLWLAGVSAPGQ